MLDNIDPFGLPPVASDDPAFAKTATDPEIEAQIRREISDRAALEWQS